MTLETLVFLRRLLHAQVLPVGADDFAEVARVAANAKAELERAIADRAEGAVDGDAGPDGP